MIEIAREDMPRRKSANTGSTPFAAWLMSAIGQRGIDLAELGRLVESDYNYMWRLSTGYRKRPSYEMAAKIGAILLDQQGALRAAGYSSESGDARLVEVPGVLEVGKVYRIARDDGADVEFVLTDTAREVLEALARGMRGAEDGTK